MIGVWPSCVGWLTQPGQHFWTEWNWRSIGSSAPPPLTDSLQPLSLSLSLCCRVISHTHTHSLSPPSLLRYIGHCILDLAQCTLPPFSGSCMRGQAILVLTPLFSSSLMQNLPLLSVFHIHIWSTLDIIILNYLTCEEIKDREVT